MSQMEAEITRLKAAVAPAAEPAPSAAGSAVEPAPLAAEPAPLAAALKELPPPPVKPAPEPARTPLQATHDAPIPGPPEGIQFRGFSDVRYRASDERGVHNTFLLGQFNLFITSKLSDKLNVLRSEERRVGKEYKS